jgi:hypothetical protein
MKPTEVSFTDGLNGLNPHVHSEPDSLEIVSASLLPVFVDEVPLLLVDPDVPEEELLLLPDDGVGVEPQALATSASVTPAAAAASRNFFTMYPSRPELRDAASELRNGPTIGVAVDAPK